MTAADNSVVIVTGGAQGIGHATARLLLGRGYWVVIADNDPEACDECRARYQGQAMDVIPTDTADEQAVDELVATTLSRHGRLDALVNNAGISNPANRPVESLSLAEWQRVLDVNLTGYFLVTRQAIPALRRSHGAIVNIASTRAFQSEADTEAYAASKGGVVALTHALAVSLGGVVRVNCVSPGWIAVEDWKKHSQRRPPHLSIDDHRQHPAGRVGRPEDVASMVAYLLSDEAGFITGQNFIVDGGMTRKMIYAD